MAQLSRMADANILDLAVVHPDDAPEVDLARLEREGAAAVREAAMTVASKGYRQRKPYI